MTADLGMRRTHVQGRFVEVAHLVRSCCDHVASIWFQLIPRNFSAVSHHSHLSKNGKSCRQSRAKSMRGGLLGDEESVHDELAAVQAAQALSERGEIYLALSVLLEYMNSQRTRSTARSNNQTEWSVLIEILNKVVVKRAAETAYEISGFLGRVGLVPYDEISDVNEATCVQDGSQDPCRKCDGNRAEKCVALPSPPSLVSGDDSNDTSSARGADSIPSIAPPFSDVGRERFRHKRGKLKTLIKTYWNSVFRMKNGRKPRPSSNQDGHERPLISSHQLNQEDGCVPRDRGPQTRNPVTEQSASRSWACGLWAVSECDILGQSEASDTTSDAILEDQRSCRRVHGNVTELGHRRSFGRFFGSFRF
jgi:hypothetical protein